MKSEYNGSLTREQFLFYEIKTVGSLLNEGLTREEIGKKIQEENFFQYPTEKNVNSIVSACFKRIDALDSDELVSILINGSVCETKQINLYAMMKYNKVVDDFMKQVIGEKYRTKDLHFSSKDLNLFFFSLQEQNSSVASWSELTIKKIKAVLKKCLVECGYLVNSKSEQLEEITICDSLLEHLEKNNDNATLSAFNYFK